MNITPTQSTLQAFGSSVASSAPANQIRQPVASEPAERPAANVTVRADAAPREEAPARADNDVRPATEETARYERPGSRLNVLV